MGGLKCIELCAGAGGQALGLEQAGFEHACAFDIDENCCKTLLLNRPQWSPKQADIRELAGSGALPKGVDLLAGGLPCPPFSLAGKQLGRDDERDLFPAALEIISEVRPRAVLIENVRGILGANFDHYRTQIAGALSDMGYQTDWRLLNASDYGVPQLRPRVNLVALRKSAFAMFQWPEPSEIPAPSVGEALRDLMAEGGWEGAEAWAAGAGKVAPTIVGGSTKHGGPDLGPTRAKRAWAEMAVDGKLIAETPPGPGFSGMPRLTVRMVARLQGFPDDWQFFGRKTAAYRQVGNAFPPPVACAVGTRIRLALEAAQDGVAVAV